MYGTGLTDESVSVVDLWQLLMPPVSVNRHCVSLYTVANVASAITGNLELRVPSNAKRYRVTGIMVSRVSLQAWV